MCGENRALQLKILSYVPYNCPMYLSNFFQYLSYWSSSKLQKLEDADRRWLVGDADNCWWCWHFLLHFHHFLSLAFSSISDTFLHFLVLSDKLAHLKSISKELDADWIQIFPPLLKMTKMWGILTLGCQDRGFTQYLNWISTMTNISVRRQYLIWIFEYLIWIFEYLNRD